MPPPAHNLFFKQTKPRFLRAKRPSWRSQKFKRKASEWLIELFSKGDFQFQKTLVQICSICSKESRAGSKEEDVKVDGMGAIRLKEHKFNPFLSNNVSFPLGNM